MFTAPQQALVYNINAQNSSAIGIKQNNCFIDPNKLDDKQYLRLLSIYLKRHLTLDIFGQNADITTRKTIYNMIDNMDLSIYISLKLYTPDEGKNLCNLLIEDISLNLFTCGFDKVNLNTISTIVFNFFYKYETF